MRYLPNILLVLALPAGALGFALGLRVLSALVPDLAQGIVGLFVGLFVGGLFMMPFIIPFFDRMAKRDLAAHRAEQALAGSEDEEPGIGDQPRKQV
jgi:hypothetical protein